MYLTIIDECLDDKHDECHETENMPPRNSGAVGGGVCICECHAQGEDPNARLVADVRESAMRARAKRLGHDQGCLGQHLGDCAVSGIIGKMDE